MAQQYELMDFVRDKHTYLNRIDDLLKTLKVMHDAATARKLIWRSWTQFVAWYDLVPCPYMART
jgi:hypothetical protein